MILKATLHIAEYSQILSQIINELFENTFIKEFSPGNLTKIQFSILRIIAAAGTHALSEFVDIIQVSRAAANKNIEKLVLYEFNKNCRFYLKKAN